MANSKGCHTRRLQVWAGWESCRVLWNSLKWTHTCKAQSCCCSLQRKVRSRVDRQLWGRQWVPGSSLPLAQPLGYREEGTLHSFPCRASQLHPSQCSSHHSRAAWVMCSDVPKLRERQPVLVAPSTCVSWPMPNRHILLWQSTICSRKIIQCRHTQNKNLNDWRPPIAED